MKRHWSFIFCGKNFGIFLITAIITIGIFLSLYFKEAFILNRFGNFIMAIGVWLSMRDTFREGLNKHKDLNDEKPVFPNGFVNGTFFNNLNFRLGDARLRVWGLVIVFIGSIVGSLGDLIIKPFITWFR